MLSIGKLKAGRTEYYLEQAEARVDVVGSVAEGMEDYYLGAREARGEWIGVAGLELGLSGAAEAEELRRVLAGLNPGDGSSLRDATSRVRLTGFDLTFSAPKSVSVSAMSRPVVALARRMTERSAKRCITSSGRRPP
jgi:conjugative relaxase-like TrwC/TraI family protein